MGVFLFVFSCIIISIKIEEVEMPTKLKKSNKRNRLITIPESKKHQPRLVFSLAMTLAIMTFIAGTAIGCFLMSQVRRDEDRQNVNAVMFLSSSDGADGVKRIIYKNGLIVEEIGSEINKAILTDDELDDLVDRIDLVENSKVTKDTTNYDMGKIKYRVFSDKLNRWVIIDERNGYDSYKSSSKAVEDLKYPIDQLFIKYFED
jgi:hypothetical protein